jgi:hypothetical protein
VLALNESGKGQCIKIGHYIHPPGVVRTIPKQESGMVVVSVGFIVLVPIMM